MTRYGMLINTKKCVGCSACRIACQMKNHLDPEESFIKYHEIETGEYPNVYNEIVPTQCMHCEDAPCAAVCPTHATYITDSGVVLVDEEKCIGCKYCMMACPYGVRAWSPSEHVVEKCPLCGQPTSVGEEPQCVAACCAPARSYGDPDDPNSDASKALAAAGADSVHRLKDVGNGPQTAYLLSAKYAEWKEEVTYWTSSGLSSSSPPSRAWADGCSSSSA